MPLNKKIVERESRISKAETIAGRLSSRSAKDKPTPDKTGGVRIRKMIQNLEAWKKKESNMNQQAKERLLGTDYKTVVGKLSGCKELIDKLIRLCQQPDAVSKVDSIEEMVNIGLSNVATALSEVADYVREREQSYSKVKKGARIPPRSTTSGSLSARHNH